MASLRRDGRAGQPAAALEVTASHQLAEVDCVCNTWVNRAVLDKASAVIGVIGVIVFIVQTDTDKGDIPLKINTLQRRGVTT